MPMNRIWFSKKNVFQNALPDKWAATAFLKNTNADPFTAKRYRWFKAAQCFYRHKYQ